MGRKSKYPPEVRERAVRLVFEQQASHDSQWSAISPIAGKMGCTTTLLVDPPKPLAVAVELQDRGVIKHQHSVSRLAPQPRLLGVRRAHRLEGHIVIVQEAVQPSSCPSLPIDSGKLKPGLRAS